MSRAPGTLARCRTSLQACTSKSSPRRSRSSSARPQHLRELDPGAAPRVLARVVQDAVVRVLGGVEGEDALARQVELTNAVLETLHRHAPTAVVLPDDAVAAPARELTAVLRAAPARQRPPGPQKVLAPWAEDYDVMKANRIVTAIDPRGAAAFVRKLASYGSDWSATGALGTPPGVRVVPLQVVAIYVRSPERTMDELDLTPTEGGRQRPAGRAAGRRALRPRRTIRRWGRPLCAEPGRGRRPHRAGAGRGGGASRAGVHEAERVRVEASPWWRRIIVATLIRE